MLVPGSSNSRLGFHKTEGGLKWWCLPRGILQSSWPQVLFTLELLTSLWKHSEVLGLSWITVAFCCSVPVQLQAEGHHRQGLKHKADVLGLTQTGLGHRYYAALEENAACHSDDPAKGLGTLPTGYLGMMWCDCCDSGSWANSSSAI